MANRKFERHEGVMLPIPETNIDTDQIVPARFLFRSRADGYGDALFCDKRFDRDGSPNSDFSMNHPAYEGASVIVALSNFGCGSSREQAVWALQDGGIEVVIAPSFGDIFYNNAFQNGLLPIRLGSSDVEALIEKASNMPGTRIDVDLTSQTVNCAGLSIDFEIDSHRKSTMLLGLSEIDATLRDMHRIEDFEARHFATSTWLAHPTTTA